MVIFRSFLAGTPVWVFIETWGFCVDNPYDIPDISISPHKKNFLKMVIFSGYKSIIFQIRSPNFLPKMFERSDWKWAQNNISRTGHGL